MFRKDLHEYVQHVNNSSFNYEKSERIICGYGHSMITLVKHVGATHDKVEQFLDPSLHLPFFLEDR